jgi:tRNA threonylcarbamoyl adenosine modification protein (Sua5/YciO/YrdC/YwlC family)
MVMAAVSLALRRGDVVCIPTDTVYGLAVDPAIPGATQKLFDVKGRGRDVPIAVLVADADQAWSIAQLPLPDPALDLAARHWPGPLTIIVRRSAGWKADIGDDRGTVGVRCPDHDLVRAWCRDVGPLAVTSANVHGAPTPPTAAEAGALLGPGAVVYDGGRLAGTPSTVVDCTVDPPRIVRQGAIVL